MKKNFLLLVTICLSVFTLLSCKRDVNPKGVEFNKTEFDKQKEKWLSSGIDNYIFKYSFSEYKPDYVIGTVTVNKENSNAEVFCTEETEENPNGSKISSDSKYYLANINAIFDALYAEYKRALKTVEAGDFEYIKIDCKYNEQYGFPEYISNPGIGGSKYKENKDGSLVGHRNEDYKFYLKEFTPIE